MLFTEQLALMLETGTTLQPSLIALSKQIQQPAFREIIISLESDISEGQTFSTALGKYPKVFSNTYINLIGASEEGGFMHKALENLLQMEERSDELRRTVKSALTYPVFLIVFSFAVVIFVLAVVFPKFGSLFSSIQDQLPATTIVLMWLSNLIIHNWWVLLAGFSIILSGFSYWLKTPSGRRFIDRLVLNLPGLRGIFTKIYCIQAFQLLSMSLSNGVSMLDALNASRDAVNNSLFRKFLQDLSVNITEGKGFSVGFKSAKFIPPIVQQMIETGEQTGHLALVLDRISNYFQRELSEQLKTLSKLIEPIMLLVMGVVVGLLVSSLILPIFKLSGAAH